LVTGYDFLQDTADAVNAELAAGMGSGGVVDTLITNSDIAPQTPPATPPNRLHPWTRDQLKAKLLDSGRHDLVFIAGHFSANSTLAADFSTSLLTTDLAAAATDFSNSIVFSPGCHAGYDIVPADAVTGVTL